MPKRRTKIWTATPRSRRHKHFFDSQGEGYGVKKRFKKTKRR